MIHDFGEPCICSDTAAECNGFCIGDSRGRGGVDGFGFFVGKLSALLRKGFSDSAWLMSDHVFTTLSAKEIKRLKQTVAWHKWILLLIGLSALLQVGSAAGDIYQLRRLSPDTTWAKIGELGFTRNFPLMGIYSGVQIRVASMAEDAFVHLCAAVIFVSFCFAFRSINRRNRILLHYIERDQQRGETTSTAQQSI
ncbi:MAG: hypothetical protein WCD79_11665 [Chthoniobacteraceae bacterium]